MEGYGVVDPGGQGEGQQSAEQSHVGQLQPLRSESGAERSAQEAVFDALPPGGGQSAKSDEERQGEHQNADRQQAQAVLAVPSGHDHQDGERQD